jgi:hypothetical protein
MYMSILRFNASYRRRRLFPLPTNENQAVVKDLVEDLQLLAGSSQPRVIHRIARIARGAVLHMNLRQSEQQQR